MKKNYKWLAVFTLLILFSGFIYVQGNKIIKPVDPEAQIRVIYPNGGETWKMGETYLIRWMCNGTLAKVKIILKWGDRESEGISIVQECLNRGTFEYKIPATGAIKARSDFRICVKSLHDQTGDCSDRKFTILNMERSGRSISQMVQVKSFSDLPPPTQVSLNNLRMFLRNDQFDGQKVLSVWEDVIDQLAGEDKRIEQDVIAHYFNPSLVNNQNRMIRAKTSQKALDQLANQITQEIVKVNQHLADLTGKKMSPVRVKRFDAIINQVKNGKSEGLSQPSNITVGSRAKANEMIGVLRSERDFFLEQSERGLQIIQRIVKREGELSELIRRIGRKNDKIESMIKKQ